MKTIGIFYGSSTGNTQKVAEEIAGKLNVGKGNIFDVSKVTADKLAIYDVLLLGTSTWGVGDLQDDWDGFVGALEKQNLSGKEVAIFGTGDSSTYSDSFCDAIGILAESVEKTGAKLVGKTPSTSDYSFDSSRAADGDNFLGLPIDEDNESEKTDERIADWVKQLKEECGI